MSDDVAIRKDIELVQAVLRDLGDLNLLLADEYTDCLSKSALAKVFQKRNVIETYGVAAAPGVPWTHAVSTYQIDRDKLGDAIRKHRADLVIALIQKPRKKSLRGLLQLFEKNFVDGGGDQADDRWRMYRLQGEFLREFSVIDQMEGEAMNIRLGSDSLSYATVFIDSTYAFGRVPEIKK